VLCPPWFPRTDTFLFILSGVGLKSLGTAATTGLLYHPRMIGDGDCEEIGGMNIGRGGKPKYSDKKPAPAPLLSNRKIPHDQTRV
jgi:hypothetical protein